MKPETGFGAPGGLSRQSPYIGKGFRSALASRDRNGGKGRPIPGLSNAVTLIGRWKEAARPPRRGATLFQVGRYAAKNAGFRRWGKAGY